MGSREEKSNERTAVKESKSRQSQRVVGRSYQDKCASGCNHQHAMFRNRKEHCRTLTWSPFDLTLCPIIPLVIVPPLLHAPVYCRPLFWPSVCRPTLIHPLAPSRRPATLPSLPPSRCRRPPARPPLPPLHHLQGRSGNLSSRPFNSLSPSRRDAILSFACLLRVALSTSFRIFKGNLCPRYRRPSSLRTTKRWWHSRTRRIPTSLSSLELPSLNLTSLFSSKQYSISTVYPRPSTAFWLLADQPSSSLLSATVSTR